MAGCDSHFRDTGTGEPRKTFGLGAIQLLRGKDGQQMAKYCPSVLIVVEPLSQFSSPYSVAF